jgi:hypothetical protein
MRFLIPAAEDEHKAEHLYGAIRKFAELQTRLKVTDRRVMRIDYSLEGKRIWAEVGHTHEALGEQLFAILETEQRIFLLCSPSRCVYHGEPLHIESRHVHRVIYFDEEDPAGEVRSDG